MKLKKCIIVLVVLMVTNVSHSYMDFNLTQIKCDGTIVKYSTVSGSSLIENKKFIGHVQRGFLYKREFYTVGLQNNIIKTDITTGDSVSILNFSKIVDDHYRLWWILFANENEILVSAYQYNETETPSKQYTYFLFRIDLLKFTAMDISIINGRNDFITKSNKKLYYTNNSGEICSFVNGKTINLGLKGRFPTLSPDGLKLAYIDESSMWSKVCIYDLSNGKNKLALRLLGKNSVYPLIVWSKEGTLLAVANDSDIFAKIIYIIDSESNKNVKKIKKSHACAWFFE